MEKESLEILRQKANQLFFKNYDQVRLTAFVHAPVACLTEDIINDTYIEFVKNVERWNFEREITPLLIWLAKTVAIRHWRDYTKNRPEHLQKIYDWMTDRAQGESETIFGFDRQETLAAMNLCIQKLSPDNRQIVDRFYFGHEKLSVIAETMGKNFQTIRNLLFRIRGVLKNCIQKVLERDDCHVE